MARVWKERHRSRVGGDASGRRRNTGKMRGVVASGGSQLTKDEGEEVDGMRGREGREVGGSESGSKCGGVMSMGQDEKSESFEFGVCFGSATPRS